MTALQAGHLIGCSTMGWEKRGNGTYYYRKEREGSRVRSVYVGSGQTASLIGQFEAMRQKEATAERASQMRQLTIINTHDARIEAVGGLINDLLKASLIAAGFHTHKRQWRKKRG
jgi:hypothetical protein